MSADWLYDVNIWILGVCSIVAFLACAAAGQWIGARFRSEESESALSVITSTQAATLVRCSRSPCRSASTCSRSTS
jgi:hypothetical protein